MRLRYSLLLAAPLFPLLSPAASARQGEPLPAEEIRFASADRELVGRLARESAVVTSPPRAGVTAYLVHLGHRFLLWMADLLRPFGRYAKGLEGVFGGAVFAAALFTFLLLVFLGVRWLVRRGGPRPVTSSTAARAPEPASPAWDAARWSRELEERIARSDVVGSLEAIWWWLARSVLGARVKDSWTSGELLASARRPGLEEPLRRLERMMYGSGSPSLEELLELRRNLERRLS